MTNHSPAPLHLLVVDADQSVRLACSEVAERFGFRVSGAATIGQAETVLASEQVDMLLLDLRVPGGSSLSLLERTRATLPATVVIVMTAFATVTSAVDAMKYGASDYLTKPFALEELMPVLDKARQRSHLKIENQRLREIPHASLSQQPFVGSTPAMQNLLRMIQKVASSLHPVLVLGESGTGKELVARAIHTSGSHASRPFMAIDCGALVPTLIESELFGHVRGAFTGANRPKEGLLTAADQGTVFLDEIGELPLDLQAKLLRALQEKEVRPVGATHSVPVRARIVAATNRNLAAMVEHGGFRKDLYFRLNVVSLRIPPLRERRDDIPLLVAHFLERSRRESGCGYSFSDEAMDLMCEYDWPGNVRELEHAIERACAMTSDWVISKEQLTTQVLSFHEQKSRSREQLPAATGTSPSGAREIVTIAELEKQAILDTIQQLKGDKLMAAKLLGIGKTTLYRKLKEYGIALH